MFIDLTFIRYYFVYTEVYRINVIIIRIEDRLTGRKKLSRIDVKTEWMNYTLKTVFYTSDGLNITLRFVAIFTVPFEAGNASKKSRLDDNVKNVAEASSLDAKSRRNLQ